MTLEERVAALERQSLAQERYFRRAFWQMLDVAYDATLPSRILQCVICGQRAPWVEWEKVVDHCVFDGGKLERYRCRSCECIFGPQKYLDFSDDFVAEDYKLLYSKYVEGDSTLNEIAAFKTLSPRADGVYLDWGCGGNWSSVIKQLRAQGWDVWGYEPSAETRSEFIVNKREQVTACFDGIFSNNVIEHFRDPVAAFADLRSVLKEGARMAHASACYEYVYSNTRFHTVFLVGRSPYVLAEKTGFRVSGIERGQNEYINYLFQRTD